MSNWAPEQAVLALRLQTSNVELISLVASARMQDGDRKGALKVLRAARIFRLLKFLRFARILRLFKLFRISRLRLVLLGQQHHGKSALLNSLLRFFSADCGAPDQAPGRSC